MEQKLKADNGYLLEYKSLLKTKPETPDKIVYPYKKELFHYEEKRRFPVYWLRIAAAIVIVLGIGVFVFTYQQKPGVTVGSNTNKTQPVKETINVEPTKSNDVAIKTEMKKPGGITIIKASEPDNAVNVAKKVMKKVEQKEIKKQPVISPAKTEDDNENIASKEIRPDQKNIAINKKQEIPQQQTLNNHDVTPPLVASFNNQTTSPVTAEQRDVVRTENEKKSSLKGFLRKATRFIERRTNISTTNEDNELLIGAVALKL